MSNVNGLNTLHKRIFMGWRDHLSVKSTCYSQSTNSVPSTNKLDCIATIWNSSSRKSSVLFWFLRHLHSCLSTPPPHPQTHIHTKLKSFLKRHFKYMESLPESEEEQRGKQARLSNPSYSRLQRQTEKTQCASGRSSDPQSSRTSWSRQSVSTGFRETLSGRTTPGSTPGLHVNTHVQGTCMHSCVYIRASHIHLTVAL